MARFQSRWFSRSATSTRPARKTPRVRLMLQGLEDRRVPATITVTGNADSIGVDGVCSLREALDSVNTGTATNSDVTANMTGTLGVGGDSIGFSSAMTISFSTQIAVSKAVTITGLGAGSTVLKNTALAGPSSRIFSINVAGTDPTITMNSMTLQDGNLSAGNNGGAILINNDPLVLNNVTFSNNKTLASGGAIASTTTTLGSLSVTSCTFSGNSAGTTGGAISGISTLTLNVASTTFTGNTAGTGGGAVNMIGATSSATFNTVTFGSNTTTTSTGGGVNTTGNSATVSFTNCSFTSNVATASNGGAFQGSGNTTTFSFIGCTISNNQGSTGGGLRFQGTSPTVTIDTSTIANNTATTAGGISNTGTTSPVMNITNSTVSGNVGSSNSGGLDITAASTTITNSTISGNSVTAAAGNGGGLTITTGALTINNSTIYNNTAGSTGLGGGIRKSQTAGTGAVTLNSTIVAGNVASGVASGAGIAVDISSSATTITINIGGGKNLIGVANAGNFTMSGVNLSGVDTAPLDAKLNALANYGGLTFTHSLQAKSPAFNAGSNVLSLTYDQRGGDGAGPNPDYPRVNGAAADVGAYEGISPDPGAKATLPGVPPINATYLATVLYTDETAIDTTTIDVNDVVLSGPGYGSPVSPTTVTFSGPATSVTATYTFTPPGGSWDYGDDGVYTLTMQPSQVVDTDGPNPVASGVMGTFAVTIALPNPLVVDNQGDVDDGDFSAGKLTLREAIRLSNATTGQTDSITFDAGLSGKTITVGSQIVITDAVNITGLGAANLKLSGGTLNQILAVNLATGTDTVTISQIKFSDGNATSGQGGAITVSSGNLTLSTVTLDSNQSTVASGAAGGAIAFGAVATLTLNNCTLTNNTAVGSSTSSTGGGGAISTTGAATVTLNNCLVDSNSSTFDGGGAIRGQTTLTLNINDSTITNNTAGGFGGAVYLNTTGSSVSVARSTVSGNTASGTGAAAGGGGGFYFFTTGTFTADNSTFSGNTAKTGGALSFRGGTVTMTQCTLSGNSATDSAALSGGGAISMNAAAATITLNNSTVYGNTASNVGGGIRKNTTSTNFALTLNSTIVAGNVANGSSGTTTNYGADIDCSGVAALVIGGSKNLIGISDAGNFSLSGTNKTGTKASPLDPMLDVLAGNGGPTQTHALKAGSPAFDSGSNVLSLTYDQRGGDGAGPLADYPRLLQSGVDVGAYEGINPVPAFSGTLANVPPINPTYKASVTYTSSVGISTGSIDVNDVRLSGPGYGSPATPTSATVTAGINGSKSVTVEYVFTPPGGTWDYTDDGIYQLDVQNSEVYDTSPTPVAAVGGKVNSMLVAIPLPVMVVDNLGDNDDGIYTAGNFTLREAINLANAAISTNDTIMFSPSLNNQTIAASPLNITDPVQIIGPGAGLLTISASTVASMFVTNIATAGSPVLFSGLTIADGFGSTGSAISIASDNVTVNDCVISNNVNSGNGGAITVAGSAGSLTVNNSRFDTNSSSAGGAITVLAGGGLFVNNCLFTSNQTNAGNAGGAIRYVGSTTIAVNVAIRNSTFFGNKTNFSGGAIGFSNVFLGTALVQNCTITGNYADYDDNASGEGGGVDFFQGAPPGKVVIDSCIISGNFKGFATPVTSDLANGTTANVEANFSLIGDTSAALNFVPDAKTTSLLGQNPLLNSLANNGGPTQTMSLQAGSPAIDNGSNPAGLTTDQRGVPYYRPSNLKTDIGAFEVQFPPTVTNVVLSDGTGSPTVHRSQVRQIIVTFSEPVNFTGSVASAFTVHRTGTSVLDGNPIGDVMLKAAPAAGPTSTVTITFDSADTTFVENGSLKDGLYNFTIDASKVSGTGGALDGDGIGGAGGDYVVIGSVANKWFRLFGDDDGNGTVNQTDFNAFRLAFLNGASTEFDFDGDNQVSQPDFNAFRLRFLGAP